MKKGFTLVEMSIVLVIIGVLMGLTVKGKQLIDSAKLRADINKVRNIQIAVAAFMTDNNGVLPDNFSTANLNKTLTNEDYTLRTAVQDLNVSQVEVRGANGIETPYYIRTTTGNDIAVVIGPARSTPLVDGSNRVLGCKIDATLDDKIQSSGAIRSYGERLPTVVPASNNVTIEATDCDTIFGTTGIPTYAMLIY